MIKKNKEKESVDFLPRAMLQGLEVKKESFSEEKLRSLLQNMGIKVTTQRLIMLKALYLGKKHITVTELHRKIKSNSSKVGLATVLRFLKQLVKSELLTEIRIGGSPARYEVKSHEHHDHLTCTRCGKICEFHNQTIEQLQTKVAEHFGFQLEYHILELYGICFDCEQKKK